MNFWPLAGLHTWPELILGTVNLLEYYRHEKPWKPLLHNWERSSVALTLFIQISLWFPKCYAYIEFDITLACGVIEPQHRYHKWTLYIVKIRHHQIIMRTVEHKVKLKFEFSAGSSRFTISQSKYWRRASVFCHILSKLVTKWDLSGCIMSRAFF